MSPRSGLGLLASPYKSGWCPNSAGSESARWRACHTGARRCLHRRAQTKDHRHAWHRRRGRSGRSAVGGAIGILSVRRSTRPNTSWLLRPSPFRRKSRRSCASLSTSVPRRPGTCRCPSRAAGGRYTGLTCRHVGMNRAPCRHRDRRKGSKDTSARPPSRRRSSISPSRPSSRINFCSWPLSRPCISLPGGLNA